VQDSVTRHGCVKAPQACSILPAIQHGVPVNAHKQQDLQDFMTAVPHPQPHMSHSYHNFFVAGHPLLKIIAMPAGEAPLAGSQGSAPPCPAPLQPQGLCQHPTPEPASAAVTWAEQTAALQCHLAGRVKTQSLTIAWQ